MVLMDIKWEQSILRDFVNLEQQDGAAILAIVSGPVAK